MPRLRQKEAPYAKVSRLFRGYGLNPQALAKVLGCSWGTADKRLSNPEDFTLGELFKVSQGAGVPMEEIRASIIR